MDDSFILLFNAHYEEIEFLLPEGLQARHWQVIIDTKESLLLPEGPYYSGNQPILTEARSVIVMQMR